MRILLAGACLRPGWPGGEPEIARTLASGLAVNGNEVAVDPMHRGPLGLASMVGSPLDWDLPSTHDYRVQLQRHRPDVVLGFYNYDDSLLRAARALSIPFVASVHIYWPICPIGTLYLGAPGICPGIDLSRCVRHMASELPPTRLPGNLQRMPAPLAVQAYAKTRNRRTELDRAARIVVPGESFRARLAAAGFHRVVSVPNGIDLDSVPAEEWNGTDPTLLFASGVPSERKGFPQFVALARRIRALRPDVQFVATSYPGDSVVRGTGRLEHADVLRWMRRALGVVAPSMWAEPFSVAVLEALASGRPVAAFDVGGMSELIGPGGGVVPRGDVEQLVSLVDGWLADPQKARTLGRAARQRVEERFDARRMVARYSDVLREVVEEA